MIYGIKLLQSILIMYFREHEKLLKSFCLNNGAILNTVSVGGTHGARAGVAYTAYKHAVGGLTKNTASMYENDGIRVNAIAPGGIKTNILVSINNTDGFGVKRQSLGMGIWPLSGTAEQIASAALFLVSDELATSTVPFCQLIGGGQPIDLLVRKTRPVDYCK